MVYCKGWEFIACGICIGKEHFFMIGECVRRNGEKNYAENYKHSEMTPEERKFYEDFKKGF